MGKDKPNPDRTVQYMMTLCKHIRNGRLDEHLDVILVQINKRNVVKREMVATANLLTMKPGTRVKITEDRIKPRYLGGLRGTVVDADTLGRTTQSAGMKVAIPVRLDVGQIRKFGPIVFVPAGCLRKLKDQTPNPEHSSST